MELSGWYGVTSDMMLGLLDEFKSVVPIVVPAVVGFMGFRKAWSFIRGAIRSA